MGVSVVLLAVTIASAQEEKDADSIQGSWKVIATTTSGVASEDFVGSRLTFEGDKLTCHFTNLPQGYPKDAAFIESRFQLDPTTSPKSFDWIIKTDGREQTVRNRIYSLEGDRLKICVKPSGNARPEGFETRRDDDCILYILERIKR